MNLQDTDFIPGKELISFFIVNQADLKYKKDGTSYFLQLTLAFKSRKIKANIWNNVDEYRDSIKSGSIVKVKGVIEEFNNENFLKVEKIRLKTEDDEIEIINLLPDFPGDIGVVENDFFGILNTVTDNNISLLLKSIFEDKEWYKLFRNVPAGKKWHHNYISGLIEHTLTMVKLADQCSKTYPDLDRNLLICGAYLHDIGKVYEFSLPEMDYSDKGRLLGHISMGAMFVKEKIGKIDNFPEKLKDKILHMILSHQGELQKGSPVVPMFKEALLLYYLDEIDSKLNAYSRIISNEKKEGVTWSKYVNLIERFIYFE